MSSAFVISDSFTRPSNTTAYGAGDLVANDTDEANVVPLSFPRLAIPGAFRAIRRARLVASSVNLTNAQFRLHLFQGAAAVDPTAGDNAAFNSSETLAVATVAGYLGFFNLTLDRAGVAGAFASGVPDTGEEIIVAGADGAIVSGLLEVLAAYTPTSAGTFQVSLEGVSYL